MGLKSILVSDTLKLALTLSNRQPAREFDRSKQQAELLWMRVEKKLVRYMRVNFKMAVPRGDRQRNLNAGFTEFATPEAFQDAQVRLNIKIWPYYLAGSRRYGRLCAR